MAITVLSGGMAAPAPVPVRLGRYVIEGVLGAGGMAVVYLARDPVLDRAVALKVLHDVTEAGASRLVREGQALARVSHPNVIQVYEVGRDRDGAVYIAMERIGGATLAAWLEQPRARREILGVFAAAGRGLAAAHAAGLVHRDFKPENVMVGDDGRVCVLDFGLARVADEVSALRAGQRRPSALAATAPDAIAGTPAYMSPEQWRGGCAGARSDQFSFCVALWRALAGEHPFDASSREALRASVLAGAANRLPRTLPRRLRAMLYRGIAADPCARLRSIDAVVAAITARPRWPWLAAAALVAAGVALAAHRTAAAGATLYAAPTAITSRGDVGRSAVSPDGQDVALLTEDAVIVQALRPGAEQRVVLRARMSHHALAWSPDGKQLAFVASTDGGRPGLVIAELATRRVRRIGPDLGAIALLGNDELVAAEFADHDLAFYSLADPGAPRRRCPLPGPHSGIRDVRFDPASDALYVRIDDGDRRSSILRIDRECRHVEVVAAQLPILSYAVRPGDHRVLVRLMNSHQLVEIGDDGASRLGQHVIQSREYAPLAITAGGAIAHCDRSVRWALDAIGRDGARRELAGGAGNSRFSVAPDGRIAQIDGLYDRGLLRVGRIEALAAGLPTIAEHATRAAWSPDGRRLAVLSQSEGGYQLAVWDAEHGMSRARALATPYDVELTWLDERRVAYPVLHARTQFHWIDPVSGETGAMAFGLRDQALSLIRAHRDRRLAFVTDVPGGARVWMAAEDGVPRALASVAIDSPRWVRVEWAADDRSLVLYDAVSGHMWSIASEGPDAGAVAPIAGAAPHGSGLTRVSDVFALADRTVVASVVASSDIYLSAPIAE